MKNSRRTAWLSGALLAVVFLLVGRALLPFVAPYMPASPAQPPGDPPLSGANAISALEARREPNGIWYLHVTYFFTGAPFGTYITAWIPNEDGGGPDAQTRWQLGTQTAKRGTNTYVLEVTRPGTNLTTMSSSRIVVAMQASSGVVAQRGLEQRIDWPDSNTWARERSLATKTPQELLKVAIELIDAGDRDGLDEARVLLERLARDDPRNEQIYIEMARVAMKTNWSPEGLRQAENLLTSAMQVRPDSVNGKIVLGYVYTHQGKLAQAQELFEEASLAASKNLWLWASWGELLVKQGKVDAAIMKYRRAIEGPRTYDTYDRARLDAYWNLIVLQEGRKDFDAVESLHRQRTSEFGAQTCYGADYAKFLLRQRGDTEGAIAMAQRAVSGQCGGANGRETLGLAYYQAWARDKGSERDDLLRQARIYLPAGPRLIYQLAVSDRTSDTIVALKATGEGIDQLDGRRFNALALALEDADLPAARRLLKLGANPSTSVGAIQIPVALMPVLSEDYEAIRLMQQFGVNYSRLRYQGATALDHARRTGNRKLLEALDRQSNSL